MNIGKEKARDVIMAVDDLAYDILDNVVSPICEIPVGSIWADTFLADLSCYADNDEELEELVKAISKRYELDYDEFRLYKDMPLAVLALVIFFDKAKPDEGEEQNEPRDVDSV